MSSVSALILAKNEEQNIEDCIKSVSFADEVVVIDDFSTDKTVGRSADVRYSAGAVPVDFLHRCRRACDEAACRARARNRREG